MMHHGSVAVARTQAAVGQVGGRGQADGHGPDDGDGQLARRSAALSDPVRLRLRLLATSADGSVCACDLVEPVGKSQPTVSHHLKVLREAGLVTSEKRGTNVWYAAVPAALESLREALAGAR